MSSNEFNEVFSRRLKYYLDKYGMTQAELADELGVGPTAVSFWCNGKKTPRMDKVDKMCELFHCKRSDLISEEGAPPSDLDVDERVVLEWYRTTSEHNRDFIRRMMAYDGMIKKDTEDDVV